MFEGERDAFELGSALDLKFGTSDHDGHDVSATTRLGMSWDLGHEKQGNSGLRIGEFGRGEGLLARFFFPRVYLVTVPACHLTGRPFFLDVWYF